MQLTIKNQKSNFPNGFTLIEGLATILITAMLLLGIFELINYSIKVTADNKNRVVATVIAEQQLEIIRSLPYDSVGTLSGSVIGTLPDGQVIIRGSDNYNVTTTVQYIDNDFDGTDSSDGGTDDLPTDYKIINITVSWNGSMGKKSITTSTLVTPRGQETSAGGGTLEILVFDATGTPIESADVHIENNIISPVRNFDAQTNSAGKLTLYGMPASLSGYEIAVSNGVNYSKSSTSPVTLINPVPTIPHASVFEETKTNISFAIDRLSNLTIKTIQQALPANWAISTNTGEGDQTKPSMSMDGNGNFYFVWQDYRSGSDAKIYGQKYDPDHNNDWTEDIVVGTANNRLSPTIIADSLGNQYITWNDGSNGNQDVYFVKQDTTGNDLWSGAKKLETNATNDDQTNPQIALTEISGNSTTTIVWQDDRSGNLDIYAQKYNPNGIPVWTNNELLINNDGGVKDQILPQIVTDLTDSLYVVWTDERDNDTEGSNIYAQKYNQDRTKMWLSNDVKINTDTSSADQYSPSLTIDANNNIYVAWTDERNGDSDIYAQKYDIDGNPVWPNDIRINTDTTNRNQSAPSIAINNTGDIYIAWTDERNGDSDIYAQKYSNVDGSPVWTNDVRININTGNSDQSSPQIAIDPVSGVAYATWNDERNGEFDIFASPIELYGSPTGIVSVPVTITGVKQIGNNPVIYKYNQTYSSNSSGVINLNNIEFDTYTLSLATGYADYEIVMTSLPNPLGLNPNESVEMILYLEPNP